MTPLRHPAPGARAGWSPLGVQRWRGAAGRCAARMAASIGAAVIGAAPAHAQTAAAAADPAPLRPLWELGLGMAGVQLPHYRGSDEHHRYVLPVPYVVYRGDILRATREGARAVLFEGSRFDFDLSLSASAPTKSEDNRTRRGMADLAPTLEIGPNLNVNLARAGRWKLDLRLPARAVFAIDDGAQAIGWTLSPVINLDARVADWNLGVQAGPLYGTRRYHAHFYDVAAADATATRPAYSAASGYAGWRWTTGVSRRFGDVWLGAFVRGDSVAGAVFDASPLVKQRHNLSFGLALSWVLATSHERVAGHD
jgi:outer membrane protein